MNWTGKRVKEVVVLFSVILRIQSVRHAHEPRNYSITQQTKKYEISPLDQNEFSGSLQFIKKTANQILD